MAYATYTTKAIVCGSKASHTSDKSYLLFTEAAGMLWASARSVREERSKQRYALQDFSLIRVSLVKGKTGWRIGSVETQSNAYLRAPSREARAGVTSCVQLLRRFLQGEEPQRALFEDVETALQILPETLNDDITLVVEHFTLRTLWQLGYIAEEQSYREYLYAEEWWQSPPELPATAARAIAQGLEVSHL